MRVSTLFRRSISTRTVRYNRRLRTSPRTESPYSERRCKNTRRLGNLASPRSAKSGTLKPRTTMDSRCSFCAELVGSVVPEFVQVYPDLRDRLVRETDNFVVIPSLGQLAAGHLLAIPKAHVHSFGQVPGWMRQEATEI